MKTKLLLLLITVSVFSGSCQKETEPQQPPYRQVLLTAKPWIIIRSEVSFNGTMVDTFPFFPDCEKDDRWIFKSDGSVAYNEAADACDGNQPHETLDVLRWAFLANETQLEIDGKAAVLEQLDATTLKISYTDPVAGTMRITYAHP